MRLAGAVAPPARGRGVPSDLLGALPPRHVLVAQVLTNGAVTDLPAPLAMVSAATELCVQRLDGVDADLAHRQLPQLRADVLLDLADVAGAGLPLDIEDVEPLVEQLVDRRARSRVPLLVNLVE